MDESVSNHYDFLQQAKCSNVTYQGIRNMNWIRVGVASAGFVVVAAMLIILLIRREYRSVLERLFIYLLLATLGREAVLFSNIEQQFSKKKMDQVCSIIGALDLYTAVLVLIYVASMIIYLLGRVAGIKQKFSKVALELGFLIITVLVPLIIATGLLYTGIFGVFTAWCWMREYDSDCHTLLQKTIAGYGFLIIIGFLSFFLTMGMVIIYYKIARRIKPARHLMKQSTIMIACLIVNSLILAFAAVIINLSSHMKAVILHMYTIAVALYDIVYPLGFLLSFKYQAFSSFIKTKKRVSDYSSLLKNGTSPPSDRITARSTTYAVTAPYTGDFTTAGIEGNLHT